MKQIPNILTLGNLLCGVLAIVFALSTPVFPAEYEQQNFLVSGPPMIYWSSVFIGIAAILDFLDGFAARLLHVQSELGKQLDSLADLVTFGVAPGILLFYFLKKSLMAEPGGMEVNFLLLFPALLVPVFAAIRLGRFNLEEGGSAYFTGLPTPAVGLTVAAFPLIALFNEHPFSGWLENPRIIYGLIVLLCYLMVSSIPFFNLKFKKISLRTHLLPILLLLIILVSIPFFKWTTVPLALGIYIIMSVGKFWFSAENV